MCRTSPILIKNKPLLSGLLFPIRTGVLYIIHGGNFNWERGDMSPSLFKILFVSPPLFNRKNHAYLLFASRKILAKNVN